MHTDKIAAVKNTMEHYREIFENFLAATKDERKSGVPENLFKAMEYSLDAGGKRLRPILCMAAAERCGGSLNSALPMALGLEMFHTASLIHDDLPCMDNDDMRRGKPSNHIVFGETMAVLAGDSLLTQSLEFPLLHICGAGDKNVLRAMKIFSSAIGPSGVCGGQVLDMDAHSALEDSDYVRKIAALKTGALIKASVLSGAALGTDDEALLSCYNNYGAHLGSAFQIIDDILDVVGTDEEMGKTVGKDAEQGKITHVTVFGLEKARIMAESESVMAKKSLSSVLGQDDFMMNLPDYLVYRTN